MTASRGTARWDAFIEYLVAKRERSEVMAALRRGAGKPAGTAYEMYPYVVPWLPEGQDAVRAERRYYTVATLFALHQQSSPVCPHSANAGSVGQAMRTLCAKEKVSAEAVERRFLAVVAADAETLPDRLRQVVTLLRGKNIQLDYAGLGHDMQRWSIQTRPVQRRWALDFFARQSEDADQEKK